MKLKAIIIEDLDQDLKLLNYLMENHFPQISILGHASGKQSALELLRIHKPDILFCDIELDEGSTSFDILAHYVQVGKKIDFEVIFMTAHEQHSYYTKAFEYEAIDYIVKPFGKERLAVALERAQKNIEQNNVAEKYLNMVKMLQQNTNSSDFLAIHLPNNKLRRLAIKDILYIEADTVQSIFYLANGEKLVAMRNLGVYRKILELDHNFFSISHAISVNLDHKKNYHHASLSLELSNGTSIKASRQGGQRFKAFLQAKYPDLVKSEDESLLQKIKHLLGL